MFHEYQQGEIIINYLCLKLFSLSWLKKKKKKLLKVLNFSASPTSLSLICPPHLGSQRLRSWKGRVCRYEPGSEMPCPWSMLDIELEVPLPCPGSHTPQVSVHSWISSTPFTLCPISLFSSWNSQPSENALFSLSIVCSYKPLKASSMRMNSVSPATTISECLEWGLSLRITWLLNGCVETLKQPR